MRSKARCDLHVEGWRVTGAEGGSRGGITAVQQSCQSAEEAARSPDVREAGGLGARRSGVLSAPIHVGAYICV